MDMANQQGGEGLAKLLADKIELGLLNTESAAARQAAARRRIPLVRAMAARFPRVGPELRQVKEAAIHRLAELVDQTEANLRQRGCQVFRARTQAEALAYADALVPDGALVVKSKSNAAKEIGLVERLEARGVRVVETDLGDRICQVGNIPTAHPLGPAVHVPVARVAEIFSRELGINLAPDHEAIVAAVREALRHNFLEAAVGITGANAIAADTGSVLVMENEGNIRAVSQFPPVHIVVAGIEKIVPTLEDGLKVVKAAALYGTAQDVGSYVSVVSGPSGARHAAGEAGNGCAGPRAVHVILLEAGRWEAAQGEFRESLYCINCGHCLRVCPVYRELGEQYGYKYFGGIGVVHTSFRYGLGKALEAGLSLCLGCGRCTEVCPSGIPVPEMIRSLRAKAVETTGLPLAKKTVVRRVLPGRRLFKAATPLQGVFFRPVQGRKGVEARSNLVLAKGRVVPRLKSRHLPDLFPAVIPAQGERRAMVGYFPGCLGMVAYTDIGAATIAVLTGNGVEVWLPRGQVCCGLPMLSAGDRATGRRVAEQNLRVFHRDDLEAVIVDCPTCGAGLRQYRQLFAGDPLREQRAQAFSAKVRDICGYLWEELGVEPPKGALEISAGYHQPCHLRGGGGDAALAMLQAIPGISVRQVGEDQECCGFGGIFSLDYYKLARTIGRRRIEDFTSGGTQAVVTACPGCLLQLEDSLHGAGASQTALHIVELLAAAYGKGGNG